MDNLDKETILLNKLLSYFSESNKSEILITILKKNTSISLRILDWLVTNYSKKHNIIIEQLENNQIVNFHIHTQYKNQLKAYSKTNFDPFCRNNSNIHNKITLDITNTKSLKLADENTDDKFKLETTVGQLNFFKWFLKNDLINYLLFNIQEIENDMNSVLSNKKCNSESKKRCCLSENNSKQMIIINRHITIKF